MNINLDKQKINKLCEQNDIDFLGLFGSYARGEEIETSDVDLLVGFSQVKSFFELAQIQEKFENNFGRQVDLVSKKTIKPLLKPYIYKDLVTLYEKK